MKVQIVFDSAYGNTERIAKAIGDAVGGEVEVINVKESAGKTIPADVLLVGSPTYGGKPTPAIQDFMNGLAGDSLKGIDVAAFDTRLSTRLVTVSYTHLTLPTNYSVSISVVAVSFKKKTLHQLLNATIFMVHTHNHM